jgi:5-methylcytosine-specific restriction endonuclease McrA
MAKYTFFEDEETGHRIIYKASKRVRRGNRPNAPSKVVKQATRRRRNKRVYNADAVAPATRTEVLSIGRCAFCGAMHELTVDHIIPRAKGGGSHRENLQCLCGPCNRWKGEELMSLEQYQALSNRQKRKISRARARYHFKAQQEKSKENTFDKVDYR